LIRDIKYRLLTCIENNINPYLMVNRLISLGRLYPLVDIRLFGRLVADGWCWFVLREEYCWLVAAGCWWLVRSERKVLVAGGW
jgi:hypothetical protein